MKKLPLFLLSVAVVIILGSTSVQAACLQSSGSVWTNSGFSTQTGQFTATFDATPSQANMSGVVGFSLNASSGYTSLATIVRFASNGVIDVRNGGVYSANVAFSYSAGSTYHFRLVINPTTKRYDVYVTRQGQAEVALATNYAFRSEQAGTSSLNNWGMLASGGSETICNMSIGSSAASPTISVQPAGQTVAAGQTATFSISATGSAPLAYQWRKNGVNISGATTSSYMTPVTTTADSGAQFSVMVSNSIGNVVSNSATLTISAAVVAPAITTQPVSQTITAGQTAIFSISATGSAPLAYQWRKNGVNISGATTSSYATPVTTTADSGAQFSVIVSNSAGSVTSNSATLAVNATAVAPTITTQPVSQTITAGQTATFSVSAPGSAPLAYQWRKNGVNISGATTSSYTTPVTTTADNGAQFSVAVSNSAGSVTSNSATLTVSASASCPCTIWSSTSVPTLVDDGPDSSVELGVTFRADSDGSVTGIRFYKSVANTGTHVGNLWSNTGALLATATFSGESASGWQQVNFSSPVVITANTTYVASYHASAGHYSGDQNYFATTGVDRAPLHAPSNGGVLNGRYAYGSGSVFPSATWNATNYWVDVVFATAGSPAPVAPAITTQPASQTVLIGQSATFGVAATGTATMNYQWKKNGVNVSGATASSYTTPAVTSADSGAQFSVVISNSAGSATSANATLTVSATTRLISANPTSLSFGSVNIGSSSLLTTSLTNSGNSVVTISNITISGSGMHASGMFVGQMLNPGQSATLSLTFAPSVVSTVTSTVVVASDATNSPTTVSLSGKGIQLISHSASLNWNASTSPVVGYQVYNGTVSGGPYTKVTTMPVAATTYKDSAVQSGTTYYYVVTSVDASNVESAYSNESKAVIP